MRLISHSLTTRPPEGAVGGADPIDAPACAIDVEIPAATASAVP